MSDALPPETLAQAIGALEAIRDGMDVMTAIKRHPLPRGLLSKSALVAAYRHLVASGAWEEDPGVLARIRLKPVRSLSGVTVVTVLTKPYACPGECIFCPDDVRMPKSYLPDEPGAQRALMHGFDPYSQVRARLAALEAVGHPTDKIELLVLGGTWTSYPKDYQTWFIRRLFDALNADDCPPAWQQEGECRAPTLEAAHRHNETARHRNVGLVIETRPDHITPRALRRLRELGVTKVQVGFQSMDDRILALNKRGHTVEDNLRAAALLRAGGFKIVAHWMPNLLGATPESDRADFARLWQGLCPDELKIYPTQLLPNTELYAYWQRGEYTPYTTKTLIDLLADLKATVPPYCRINRVIRDIPSTHVVAGNKRTSLRQDVLAEMQRRGTRCRCIRCREVRDQQVQPESLRLEDFTYQAAHAEEHFLQFVTPDDRLAGFLRLSLPAPQAPDTGMKDLTDAAIIREVHVYGQSLPVGAERRGAAQHIGLGTRLLEAADRVAREAGFPQIAVIAAVGTRQYYLARGFERGEHYLVKRLSDLSGNR
ncbi:MAG TPA: tRNA uridine(34) 5-carboxymethylaminomethyl modification radical SAM/GNAT enzyme Elp3 [Chloroflexi bacterium]|nr:tRNA uridine(34) 5-carboxymethylaminomethyl modification radical SAM/GNAT enzyme Elp3 [Chloroflexota bacterium]